MKRASTLLLAITTALAAPRAHALLLGGGSLETDCFAAFDGPAVDRTFVVCGDGDPGSTPTRRAMAPACSASGYVLTSIACVGVIRGGSPTSG